MRRAVREAVRRALERRGYSVAKLRDPFAAQARLLGAQPARTVFDLGANEGETVARYRALFPSAEIFAFEPFPGCVETLERRFGGDPRVHVVEKAVSDAEGSSTLFVSGGARTHSLQARPDGGMRYYPEKARPKGTVEVGTTTLDRFCAERSIERIDALKIDVEGAEIRALRGARDLLGRQAVSLLLLETMFVEHYAGQALYHELAQLLSDHGYSLFDLYDLRRSARNGQLRFGNALFVSERLRRATIEASSASA